MYSLETYANRNYHPRVDKDGSRRGLDQYHAFKHGSKPVWWTDDVPCAATTFAVYENVPGKRDDALLFGEEQLVILSPSGVWAVRFEDIERMGSLAKKPVSLAVRVVLRSGAVAEIPAYAPRGVAFSLYRFLLSALRREHLRNPSRA
jgi:hypothetical protein